VLAFPVENVTIIQADVESDDGGERVLDVLVRFTRALLRQVVVHEVSEMLGRQISVVEELGEGLISATLELHVRHKAVSDLLIHVLLESKEGICVLHRVFHQLRVFTDLLALFFDVLFHL